MPLIRSTDQQPLFEPPSSWTPPTGPLPMLSGLRVALDTETKDEGLAADLGPGWAMDMGHIIGVSAAWDDQKIYVPIRHPSTQCREQGEVLEWVEHILRNCEVIFFNRSYDMGWFASCGLPWPEQSEDAYAACVMIDENWESYTLDACCRRAGIPGKNEAALRNAANAYGVDPKSDMWRLPARHVGPYAEDDAVATLGLWSWVERSDEFARVRRAYQTELDLMPVIYDMRRRGIRVDDDAATQAQGVLRTRCSEALAEIGRISGRRISMADLRSPDRCGDIFQRAGVDVPLTKKTRKPSVTKAWLEDLEHPLGALVRTGRQTSDLADKFIGTYILDSAHLGRIHADIHQLRSDEGGTRSYRLSYSAPPLQQMPARDPVLAPMIRRIFLPEDGELWAAPDYSQQEPRLAVHLASLSEVHGADEAVRYYSENADADFHTMVAQLANIGRTPAKIINLGLMYGMGLDKLARSLGMSLEEATQLIEQYHSRVPWVKGLTDKCSRLAQERGFIRLIDGARCHFDHWVPYRQRTGRPMRLDQATIAEENHAVETGSRPRRLERSGTHKAMNRAVQGGAARQTKMAMVACHREGLLPLIQLHDELGFSLGRERDGIRAADIMINVVKLRVPVKVDLEWGRSWGDAKHRNFEEARAA